MKTIISWQLPIKIANEANSTEHWTQKHRRHKIQKMKIKRAFLAESPKLQLPLHVTLTRIAPRDLDCHDNLPVSMKWVVDSISDCIFPGQKAGRADDSKLITWQYKQKKGLVREYALGIDFEFETKIEIQLNQGRL